MSVVLNIKPRIILINHFKIHITIPTQTNLSSIFRFKNRLTTPDELHHYTTEMCFKFKIRIVEMELQNFIFDRVLYN